MQTFSQFGAVVVAMMEMAYLCITHAFSSLENCDIKRMTLMYETRIRAQTLQRGLSEHLVSIILPWARVLLSLAFPRVYSCLFGLWLGFGNNIVLRSCVCVGHQRALSNVSSLPLHFFSWFLQPLRVSHGKVVSLLVFKL